VQAVPVPAAYTPHDCSGGGERVHNFLSVRTQVGTNCALLLDRDEHAARNIHCAGQALRRLAGMPAGRHREAPSL